MKKLIFATLMLTTTYISSSALACQALLCEQTIQIQDIQGPYSWGQAQVMQLNSHFISGQIDEASIAAIKSEGITVVINLRMPQETTFPAEELLTAQGISYYHIPVNGSKPLERAVMEQIDQIVLNNSDKKILIYCASGNRAAAWYGTHLVRQGMEVEMAVNFAKVLGISRASTEQLLRNYLATLNN